MARMFQLQGGNLDLALEEAASVVLRGGVLAMPTESFYALGVSPFHEAAVQRLCRIKGRPDDKPLLVLIADLTQLDSLVKEVPAGAAVLMKQFWPGPLTIVFPAARSLPASLTAGSGTVGIRQPADPTLRDLLRLVGPLTGTSANRSGEPPAGTAAEVQASLGPDLDLILDGGPTAAGLPSTIVQTAGSIRVLRAGPISREQIEKALVGANLALAS
ncbi:MAG: threonylcarbamoyl-AMP synthase [Nitrospirae bacterium]|nr:threonylcarbamoyl-AMP synthase [Nitrospirota bacterium]